MEQTRINEELIDIEQYSISNKIPPAGKRYKVKVDDKAVVFHSEKVTGRELLEAACKTPTECYSLYQKLRGCDFEKVDLTETVNLIKGGVEHFVTKPPEVFYYDFDDEPETTDLKSMTPDEILQAGGVDPKTHYLVQVHPDGSQISYKDKGSEHIKMKCPRMKFISVLNGPTPVS